MTKYNLIHIYSQPMEHQDAYIVGDKEGLRQLRNAIDEALNQGSSNIVTYSSDGEGYVLNVALSSDDELHQLMLPYPEWYSRNGLKVPEDVICPWDLVK